MTWAVTVGAVIVGIFVGFLIRYMWELLSRSLEKTHLHSSASLQEVTDEPGKSVEISADVTSSQSEIKDVRLSPDASNASEILLHLSSFRRLDGTDVAPVGMTQRGMIEALGIQQGTLAKVLHGLEASGAINSDKRHVSGSERRLKVYWLTPLGRSVAIDIQRRRNETNLITVKPKP